TSNKDMATMLAYILFPHLSLPLIEMVRKYARFHVCILLTSPTWNVQVSPFMYAAPDRLWIEAKKTWIDPFSGRTLSTAKEKGKSKKILQHSILGEPKTREVDLPECITTKGSCFGFNSWTVTQNCIVVVADGHIFVYDLTCKNPSWEMCVLEGQHKYASVSSN